MYQLEFLSVAKQDLTEIVRYISHDLKNPTAAERLAMEIIEAAEKMLDFPYANPAHIPIRSLKHECRKLLIHNYLLFYWVDEAAKTLTIARVIYAKREYGRLLK